MLLLISAGLSLTLCSCTLGPNYSRPEQRMPTTYRSATTREASTQPAIARDWWQLFNDPTLIDLEEAALQGNPGLDAAMARVAQARAAARIVDADFYPVITLDPSIERARTPLQNKHGNAPNSRGAGGANTETTTRIPFDLNYEIDIWGKIRRSSESARATAFASELDYEVVLQTLESDVAQDYFAIRSLASQEKILAETVQAYREQVALNQRGLNAGVIGPIDLAQATALLQATIADQIEVQRQGEILEHALAVLLGKAPSELDLNSKPLDLTAPAIPSGLPSELLRRRPDVVEAEQNLVAANAQIGVAQTLFYPSLSLTGLAGFESFDVRHSLDWENRAWAIGADLSAPIFEGGRLTANLEQAKARYLELQADYRTSVLSAIRDVEDALTELHLRVDEYSAQQLAVDAARDYLRLSQTQYRQGLTNYLTVIDAERTLQSNQIQAAQLYNQRLNATVLLIKALGGGWNADNPSSPVPTTNPSP
jgi:multidrug efflux system outer membrane protein